MFWALMDGHLCHLLVTQRGWTTTNFTQWLADSLAAPLRPASHTRVPQFNAGLVYGSVP